MSFTRSRIYEFDTTGTRLTSRDTRVVICAEPYLLGGGMAACHFWVEYRVPEHWSDAKLVPAGVTKFEGEHFSGVEMADRTSNTGKASHTEWDAHTMLKAVALGDVSDRSAADLVWAAFWTLVVRKRAKWLIAAAPDWWKLVDPRKGDLVAEAHA